jgi:hypothetical protein
MQAGQAGQAAFVDAEKCSLHLCDWGRSDVCSLFLTQHDWLGLAATGVRFVFNIPGLGSNMYNTTRRSVL